MEELFITKIHIHEVRHLKDFDIPLSETEMKHLILTGRNGSGKTSVLLELNTSLQSLKNEANAQRILSFWENPVAFKAKYGVAQPEPLGKVEFSVNLGLGNVPRPSNLLEINTLFLGAKRNINYKIPKGFLGRTSYDRDSGSFLQFLVDLKAEEAFAKNESDFERVSEIELWFKRIEGSFQFIFGDTELEFQFDRVQRNFFIQQGDKTKIDLNQLSDGYNQLIGIVSSIIMTTVEGLTINLDAQAIVLIDEIETHLHIDLQKKILHFLTSFFPKIQFIVTTHSPFVLNSVDNAVICDLERRIVTEDLSGYSSEMIVESYFSLDKYSQLLKDQVDEYEMLMRKEEPSLEEEDRIDELESYFDTLPKYLSDELTIKLQQIRIKNLRFQK